MRVWKQLVVTEAVALAALVLAAALVAAYGALDALHAQNMVGPAGAARIGLLGTLLFGIVPVTAFGAPFYVWLSRAGRANWWSVSAVALAPAVVLMLVAFELAFVALLCGPTVAWLTHFASSKWVSPNSSSKPTPLRGAA